ncbi:MAG: rhamnulokinase family protein [Coriobacteriia bacterium]|nr:rhamnulokinase family protein [Coriobacteriia bacterium]
MAKKLNKECYAAIDLGASSGRVVIGYLQDDKIKLEEIYRFDNIQQRHNNHDCWDMPMIEKNIINGLAECKKKGFQPKTIGIDTWGVDFVCIDKDGKMIGDAVAYRDSRTDGIMDETDPMSFNEIYKRAGIQKLAFNTIYQHVALRRESPEIYEKTDKFLMIPEYLMYRLTGVMMAEYTNCSTTSMLNTMTFDWDEEIFEAYGFDREKFLTPQMPGEIVGPLKSNIAKKIGYQATVVLVATHDTGSAYLAIPSSLGNSANLSSGTWSLLGCENKSAITNKFAQDANFTNEGGYQKRFRFIKNIMGLWMIQCVKRELNCIDYVEDSEEDIAFSSESSIERFAKLKYLLPDVQMKDYSFPDLIQEAKNEIFFSSVVNVNDDRFLSPKSMIEEIQNACRDNKFPVPKTVGQLINCIYNSLSLCYVRELNTLSFIMGEPIVTLNIVGGGCQDDFLNQSTANVTRMTVFAGPVEGTSLGNLGIQFILDKKIKDLGELKKMIRNSFEIKEYEPFTYESSFGKLTNDA